MRPPWVPSQRRAPRTQIACVADLLDAAAEECQKRIGRSARFRTDLRQLQAAWRLSPAPSRAAPGGGAEYPIVAHVQLQDGVDLKHPDAEQLASEEQVTIVAGPEVRRQPPYQSSGPVHRVSASTSCAPPILVLTSNRTARVLSGAQGAVRVQAGATHRQADGLEAVEALLTSKQEDFIRAAVALRLRYVQPAPSSRGGDCSIAAVQCPGASFETLHLIYLALLA